MSFVDKDIPHSPNGQFSFQLLSLKTGIAKAFSANGFGVSLSFDRVCTIKKKVDSVVLVTDSGSTSPKVKNPGLNVKKF